MVPKTATTVAMSKMRSQLSSGNRSRRRMTAERRTRRSPPMAVSYTHLDVYKRQVLPTFAEAQKRALALYEEISATAAKS